VNAGQAPGPSQPLGQLPSFSVIVPTHDRRDSLRQCLRHVAALDYPRDRLEVIVVDDGSSAPVEVDAAPIGDELELTVLRQRRSGPARARNAAAERARGEYLAFTDDDCRPSPEWLVALAARIAAIPDAAVGGTTVNALPGNLCSTASQLLVDYLYTYYNADPGHARFLTSNNLALPADLFLDVGGFDTSFSRAAAEDRDLCHRLIRMGATVIYEPGALVYHAHPLGLAGFVCQHFAYGQGAFRFHRLRDPGWNLARHEPLGFYTDLVRSPFGRAPAGRATVLAGLLVVSQLANAAGFGRELIAER
jgi:glycosyltransferase involved in cell wall biosynthesis